MQDTLSALATRVLPIEILDECTHPALINVLEKHSTLTVAVFVLKWVETWLVGWTKNEPSRYNGNDLLRWLLSNTVNKGG